MSRPSRGAWIEILTAMREDSENCASRPSRGAWIEILSASTRIEYSAVAPLAGRVD